MRRRSRGFTVVELMVVVSIIALAASIAVPNLLRGRHDAAEAAAQETLRQLMTAMHQYKMSEPPHVYPNDLALLGPREGGGPAYINEALATGKYQGYMYIVAATPNSFTIRAFPQRPGVTGSRIFAITDTGVLTVVGGGDNGPGG